MICVIIDVELIVSGQIDSAYVIGARFSEEKVVSSSVYCQRTRTVKPVFATSSYAAL